MIVRRPKKRWICSCKRINDAADLKCSFCGSEKPEEKKASKIKKVKAYDELYLWPVFSRYVRLRDTDKDGVGKCFTCSVRRYWRDLDCGHGAGRQHKGTKYNEKNNHVQCGKCNGFEGGRREVYKLEMDKRYGPGTWGLMEMASRKPFKLGKTECDIMITFYEQQIEKILETKSLRVKQDYDKLKNKV